MGKLYIIQNESMPGMYKVGITTKTMQERLAQLYSTGVPTPFRVRYVTEHENFKEIEKAIHSLFSKERVNNSREFFEFDEDTIELIINLIKTFQCEERSKSAKSKSKASTQEVYAMIED
jgi:hypothetical protein